MNNQQNDDLRKGLEIIKPSDIPSRAKRVNRSTEWMLWLIGTNIQPVYLAIYCTCQKGKLCDHCFNTINTEPS